MTVYLLHLNRPMSRGVNGKGQALTARHYLGFTNDLARRLQEHSDGRGARLLQVCQELGIGFSLARTWSGGNRAFERRIKRCHNTPRLCPVCNPDAFKNFTLGDDHGDESEH